MVLPDFVVLGTHLGGIIEDLTLMAKNWGWDEKKAISDLMNVSTKGNECDSDFQIVFDLQTGLSCALCPLGSGL